VGMFAGTIRHSGEVNANAIGTDDNGNVQLRAADNATVRPAGAGMQFAGEVVSVDAPVNVPGNVLVRADDLTIAAGVTVDSGNNVQLQNFSPGVGVAVSDAPVEGSLNITTAELDVMTAASEIQIQSTGGGAVEVLTPVSSANINAAGLSLSSSADVNVAANIDFAGQNENLTLSSVGTSQVQATGATAVNVTAGNITVNGGGLRVAGPGSAATMTGVNGVNVDTNGGSVEITAGAGIADLRSQMNLQVTTDGGRVAVQGGTGAGARARLAGDAGVTVNAGSGQIQLNAGTGGNADAIIEANLGQGTVSLTTNDCVNCAAFEAGFEPGEAPTADNGVFAQTVRVATAPTLPAPGEPAGNQQGTALASSLLASLRGQTPDPEAVLELVEIIDEVAECK
ncbi:MAG: hypothetical protein ACR2RB_03515, partial [Gammaproteobacteria bacterium]